MATNDLDHDPDHEPNGGATRIVCLALAVLLILTIITSWLDWLEPGGIPTGH